LTLTDSDADGDLFGPATAEINRLEQPTGMCAWDRGCSQPATHNVVQYDSTTAEDLVDGVDANYCEPHAHARKARLDEWE
jgi:hypothetical protein